MKYRRDIDGLRAVAVLPVILFHAGFSAFSGGFVGVDVFFVISGYLITTIILSEKEKGTFSLVSFYERRARRILPALFFMMLICIPFAWVWLLPNHLKDFCQSLLSVSLFSSNILFWRESSYFGTASELKPLLHTWSLAVEEQYYLLFPLFLMIVWKLRKRWIFGSLIVVAIGSLFLSQWGAYNYPSANFYLLPARAWELALGAIVAFYSLYNKQHYENLKSSQFLCQIASAAGILLIIYSIGFYDKKTPFPSLYAIAPTVGTALIVAFSSGRTIVGKVLSTRVMVGIGLISYSIYLWHQPLFVFARHRSMGPLGTGMYLCLSILSIVMAYVSWRYIERPFRSKNIINRRRVFSFAVAGSLLFASFGFYGHLNRGFENRPNNNGQLLSDISKRLKINSGLSNVCDEHFTLSPECSTSDEPEVLVWGDSYAMHLVPGVLASYPDAKLIQMTKSFCGPFFDISPVDSNHTMRWAQGCVEFNEKVREWIDGNRTVKYAFISSMFSQYLKVKTHLLMGDELKPLDIKFSTKKFIETLDHLKNKGITPIVISPTPHNKENTGECLAKSDLFGYDQSLCDFEFEYSPEISEFLKEVSRRYKVVYLDDVICSNGRCKASVDGKYIFRDSGHLSIEGSSLIGQKLDFYNLVHTDMAEDSHIVQR